MTIELVHEAGIWPDSVLTIANQVESKLFAHFDLPIESLTTTILLTDDAHIQILNRKFRNKNNATDVLSWPAQNFTHKIGDIPHRPVLDNGPFGTELGDVALGIETCQRDAEKKIFDHHITHLILHGFLHLFGYDHVDDSDAVIMEALEVEILETLFINNPYSEA